MALFSLLAASSTFYAPLWAADKVSPPDSDDPSGLVIRTWYDAGGRHTIEARLVEVLANSVKLQKADGKTIEITLEKLSPIDRSYVEWATPLTEVARSVPKRNAKQKVTTNTIGMKLVLIPAGQFTMGDDDRPVGQVRISKPFWMGMYEVTQAEFQQVTGQEPSYYSAKGEGRKQVAGLDTTRFPVESVAWSAARDFCDQLSKKERKKYRLPTEAEWEYACRAGTTTKFHFGKGLSSAEANVDGSKPLMGPVRPTLGRTTTVGSYRPNLFGLYDMHGNVSEWSSDWWTREGPVDAPKKGDAYLDPRGPKTGDIHLHRGGSFQHAAGGCTAASRSTPPENGLSPYVGFRIVWEPYSIDCKGI
jgi:formylglycine-generating enzyme required for sulfatase activity